MQPTRPAQARILVADCDSLQQRDLWLARGPADARRVFVGRLRTAVLLGQELVLTQAQVLDGVLLLELGPQGLADALGVGVEALPVVVVGPRPDLAAALDDMRARPDFEWSSLRALGESDETRVLLEQQRQQWIREAGADCRLRLEAGTREMDVAAQLGDCPVLSKRGRELSELLRVHTRRSSVRALLHASLAEREIGTVEHDRLQAWWSRGYFAAIAAHWDAAWIDFSDAPGDLDLDRLGPGALAVGGSIITQLEAMPPTAYVLARYQAREALANWRLHPDKGALMDVAYALQQATRPPDRHGTLKVAVVRSVLLLALAVLAVVLAVVGHDGSLRWAVGAGFVVLLLQAVPWADLATWRKLRAQQMQAVMHLTR